MGTLTLAYARSHNIGGILIRNADLVARRWSHCGIVTEAGTVVEATAFKGVVETPWTSFAARYPGLGQRTFKAVDCPDPERGIAWARTQIGRGYDYWALVGLAMGRESWGEPSRWHCSELVEQTCVEAGRRRFLDHPTVISPNLSYMVI